MKRIFTTCILGLVTLFSNAQSVFYEDFESGLLNQFTQDYIVGTRNWVTATGGINLGGTPATFEGDSAAHFYYGGYSGDITTLTSPSLDLSAGGYKLSFALVQKNWVGDQNTLSVYYSGDDGVSWTLIDSITANLGAYQEIEYALEDYASLTSTSKIRFSGWIDYGYAIGLDVVNVFLPPADDAELTTAVSPITGCGLGNEVVSVLVYNNGLDTIFSIDASYEVDVQSASETFAVEIAPGATDTLTFSSLADLSVAGDYDFVVWANLTDDLDPNNDTIMFSVTSIPVISSLPYSEDFESGSGGWVSGGTLSPWQLGDPETAFIDTAHSGVNAWVTNLTGSYPNGTSAYVESPCMDFSSLLVDPVFRFAFICNSEVNWDGTWIEASTDAGATWSTIGSLGEGTNWYNNADEHGSTGSDDWWDAPLGGAGVWSIGTHLLDGTAGSSQVKVRVFFFSDGSFNGYEGFAFDDIEIFEQPSINAGVTEILSPITGCGLGMETVTVVIENFGDADLVDFPIEYNAGMGIVTEIITDTLFASSVDTFSFATMLDLSVNGDYNLGVWTAVVGDGDVLNDSVFNVVTSAPIVSSLPYSEDFENGTGGWYSTGEEGIWELGDPEGVLIDTANSGVNAWATNLNTLYYVDDQVSYLISPCFDFSNLVIDPILEFAFNAESEAGWDGMWLEVSTDAGQSWSTVGNFGEGTNWYNNEDEHGANFDEDWWDGNSGGWTDAEHLLDGVAGYSDVIVRFVFRADDIFSDYEGFAVDDISITEQPPVNSALVSLNSPTTECGLTDAEYLEVTIGNLGSLPMDSVVVSYSINNGNPVTEVFQQAIAVNDSATLVFTGAIDMNTPGAYEISVWTSTVGDGDTSNDTMNVTVYNIPIVSNFPYEEDFENGPGGWTATGTNGVWELGDPEGMIIDTAYSGINAWATNLDTLYYNNGQLTYLTSPCLDFSSLSDDPIMNFAFISESEAGWDGMWLEVSVDGGSTWSTVGEVGDGTNWYNNADEHGANFDEDWWDDLSDGDGSWIEAENLLTGVAGLSGVQIRFVFSSDVSFSDYEGFAIDDIVIRPQPQLDLVMIGMDAPDSGCSLGDETVTVTFWNKGLQTVSGFDLGFKVDGNPAQTETYAGSIAHGDSASYTFAIEMADLSAAGVHSIDVFTALLGDEDTSSDTVFSNAVENFGTSTPLSQSENTPVAIPDATPSGATSSLYFCGLPTSLDGCLEIANVTIDSIAHTWLADLDIYLISPAGDTLELSTDNGGSADNLSNVVFSDTSTNDITLQTFDIIPGIYHTEDSAGFAGLYNGQDPNGSWSLLVIDDVGSDIGTLIGWSMTFVDNAPSPVLAYSDTTICLTQVLEVTTDSYDSYLWSTGNNSQTAQLFGNVLGLGQHEISVTVDDNGCTGVSNTFTLTVDACAGIEELGNLTIDVYPNPSNGSITLSVEGNTETLDMTVQDLNGKIVYAEQLGQVNNRLQKNVDLNGLANGVYLLRLNNGNDSLIKKLVIQ